MAKGCITKLQKAGLFVTNYSRIDKILWNTYHIRQYHFKLFKFFIPQILLSPFMTILSHLNMNLPVYKGDKARFKLKILQKIRKIGKHYFIEISSFLCYSPNFK